MSSTVYTVVCQRCRKQGATSSESHDAAMMESYTQGLLTMTPQGSLCPECLKATCKHTMVREGECVFCHQKRQDIESSPDTTVTLTFDFEEIENFPGEPPLFQLAVVRRASVGEALTQEALESIGETFAQTDRMQELLAEIGDVIADGSELRP